MLKEHILHLFTWKNLFASFIVFKFSSQKSSTAASVNPAFTRYVLKQISNCQLFNCISQYQLVKRSIDVYCQKTIISVETLCNGSCGNERGVYDQIPTALVGEIVSESKKITNINPNFE
jgi:hypothetical protein